MSADEEAEDATIRLDSQESTEAETRDDATLTAFQKAQMKRRLERRAARAEGGDDPVKAEVDKFFNQGHNWYQLLENQGVDEKKLKKIGKDKDRWEDLDKFKLISEHFNVVKWWSEVGEREFPMMYIVARMIAALPDSNGHQERTFSTGQWMDDRRRRRQTDKTFEMKTLLYRNRDFMSLYKDQVDVERKREAGRKTRELLGEAVKRRDEQVRANALPDDDDNALEDSDVEDDDDDDDDDDDELFKAMNELFES